jgi:hypothetical protein
MTFAVSISATTTKIAVASTAPAAGQYQCRLLDETGAELHKNAGDTPSFSFTGVAAGHYGVEMCRLDANGAVIAGSLVTAVFNTGPDGVLNPPAPDTVQIDVPVGLAVTVTQE